MWMEQYSKEQSWQASSRLKASNFKTMLTRFPEFPIKGPVDTQSWNKLIKGAF